MKGRVVPILAVAYFLAMLAFVTYPGYVPFDRIRPLVLGMPFSLFWQVAWISGSALVLGGVFLWERSARGGPPSRGGGESPSDDGEGG